MILGGKELAKINRENTLTKYSDLDERPKLVIIQCGDRPDSNQYVKNKISAAKLYDVNTTLFKIPITEEGYLENIRNVIDIANNFADEIILQVPVPGVTPQQQDELINLIDSLKDVDCMTSKTEGQFYSNTSNDIATAPCTPTGIVSLLDHYKIPIESKKVCIIGRSKIVGRPLAHMFTNRNATVTLCHSYTSTSDVRMFINTADIIVCAVGIPNFINSSSFSGIDWSSKTLIDVGTNRVGDAWCGDIEESLKQRSYAYTPVPGGVGPMTISSLITKVFSRLNK